MGARGNVDLFSEGEGSGSAIANMRDPLVMGMSRRKQQQVAAATKRQHDKYAVEKEVDLDEIEDVGDRDAADATSKVRAQTCEQIHSKHDLPFVIGSRGNLRCHAMWRTT
jgi:hypothetical protein